MRKAPWPDFAGAPIHEGDTIRHPSGEHGVVVFLPHEECHNDQWRIDYGTGDLSRLCFQIGDKGQAVVINSTKEQGTMNDKAIEQEIQAKGLTAPRVTPADIEANIAGEYYFTAEQAVGGMTSAMVDRFLAWKLPADFAPDAGISFESNYEHESPHWPTGTNLLHAGQAKEMLRHVVCGAPVLPALALLTFCVLVLRNGFTVTGESACASPENFDAELGRKIARKNAIEQVWPLMGYELRTKLARRFEFGTGGEAQSATELKPHQQRVVAEKAELDERLDKLRAFFGTEVFSELDDLEMDRLQRQAEHMAAYSEVLGKRIAAFAG